MSCENKLSGKDNNDFAQSLKMFQKLEARSSFVQSGGIFIEPGRVIKIVKNSDSK